MNAVEKNLKKQMYIFHSEVQSKLAYVVHASCEEIQQS